MRKRLNTLVLAAACAVAATPVAAKAQTWAKWERPAGCAPLTTIYGAFGTGTVSFSTLSPGAGSAVGVQDALGVTCGNVTQSGGQGSNYFNSSTAYSPTPDNVSFIQINQGLTGTITFSEAVLNPYIALISVGQPGLSVGYQFDQAFQVVSDNTAPNTAYWGSGTYTTDDAFTYLLGTEFSGVLKFDGWVSSITFTTDRAEDWHGFTVGAAELSASQQTLTPEPSTYALMFAGLAGLGFVARRRRNA